MVKVKMIKDNTKSNTPKSNKNNKMVLYKPKNMVQQQQQRMRVAPPLIAQLISFPFDQNYFGAKAPDESMIPTTVFFSRDISTFQGPASNGLLYGNTFMTSLGYQSIQAYSGTSSAVAWKDASNNVNTTASSKIASATNSFGLMRAVAGGVRIKNMNTINNTAGVVHYCVIPVDESNTTVADLPTTIAQMAQQPTYGTVNAGQLIDNPYVVRHLPYDNRAYEFKAFGSGYNSDETNVSGTTVRKISGWGNIVLIYEGFPTGQPCLEMEHIVHYECTIKNTTGSVVQATDAQPFSPNLMAATANLVSRLSSGYENTETAGWSKKFSDAFNSAYDLAVGAIPYVQAGLAIVASL